MADSAKQGDKLNIREMTEDDIDPIRALDNKLVGKERSITYSDPIEFYLGGEYAMSFVAEIDGKIVGFVLGRLRDSDTAWLQSVAIDPEYRRKGIGNKLVGALIARCRSKGAKTLNTVASWHDWSLLSFLSSLEFSRSEMVDLKKVL